MMPSRGMGAISPKKIPKNGTNVPKKGKRKDGDTFDLYAEGGEVWDRPNPKKKSKALDPKEKARAKARAKAAGRPYPNLIDNMSAKK
jgi:hypothetical protein